MRAIAAIACLCAACGSDMLGQRVASLPGWVWGLVGEPTKLYAADYPYDIYEIEPGGGSKKVLERIGSTVFAAAGNQLYFPLSGGGIAAYDTAGGGVRSIAATVPGVQELLADAERVYFVDSNSSGASTVHAIRSDGTGLISLGSGMGIFQDDQALYWMSAGQIVRASKASLSAPVALTQGSYSRVVTASGASIYVAAASGGSIYWAASSNQVLTMRADGSATAPRVFATSTVQGDVTAIQVIDGVVYVEVTQRQRGDCCMYVASIVQISASNELVIARAENVSLIPTVAASRGSLFWGVENGVYRVR